MSIHNQERILTDAYGYSRMGAVLLGVAVVVVLAGFGCEPQRTPPVGDLPAAGADGTITSWTSYTSPTLGITIPYPEGWVATEGDAGVTFHNSAPPSVDSEYPAEMWADSFNGSVDEFLAQFRSGDILERSEVMRSGKSMQRVVLRHDLFGSAVSYIWSDGGVVRRIGGRADATLEYAVNNMEVSR